MTKNGKPSFLKKGCQKKKWEPVDVPPIIFQISNRGNEFKVHNCQKLQDYLLPFIQQQVQYYKEKGETGVWMKYIEEMPERLKDCKTITATFNTDLLFLFQLFGLPLPIENVLKYEIKLIGDEDQEGLSFYFKIEKKKLSDNNIKYTIQEDSEKGASVMGQFYQSMVDVAMELDSTLINEKIDFGNTDISYVIVNKNNIPLEVFRETTDFRIRNEEKKRVIII